MRASSRTGSKATEEPCLEKQNKTKTQANRMDTKPEPTLLLHTRKTPQPQRQILPQSKWLGKSFQSNGPKKQLV